MAGERWQDGAGTVGCRSLLQGQAQQHSLDGTGVQIMRVTSPDPRCVLNKTRAF